MAVPARTVAKQPAPKHHPLDVTRGRVQAGERRGGGATVGAEEEQTQHELRQAEQSSALLLRQEHHQEVPGTEVRLQVCVFSRDRQDRDQSALQGEHHSVVVSTRGGRFRYKVS